MKYPERIGKYRMISELGAGSMGVVLKARQEIIGRVVALKLLPIDADRRDPQLVKRFRLEALAAARILHPNMVTVYEVGKDAGFHYISMEYVSGRPLDPEVWGDHKTYADVLHFFHQGARGLAAAHAVGIIHRDIKPKNIMYDDEGTVKVLDFGIARLDENSDLTKTGTIMGSPPYMSPEQARGDKTDVRSDIFSYGVVMYEVLTGQKPFLGANIRETIMLRQHLKDLPPPISRHRDVPGEIQRIVNKCMAPRPEHRYQKTTELVGDLEVALFMVDRTRVSCAVAGEVYERVKASRMVAPWRRLRTSTVAAVLLFVAGTIWMYPIQATAFFLVGGLCALAIKRAVGARLPGRKKLSKIPDTERME